MSSIANASVGAIQKLKGENDDLEYLLDVLRAEAYNATDRLKAECISTQKTYAEMSDEAASLIGKAGKLRQKAENVSDYLFARCTKLSEMLTAIDRMEGILTSIDRLITLSQDAEKGLKAILGVLEAYQSLNLY